MASTLGQGGLTTWKGRGEARQPALRRCPRQRMDQCRSRRPSVRASGGRRFIASAFESASSHDPIGIEECRSSLGGNRLDQIPSISIEVLEDRHDAIWLVPRLLDKTYTLLRVGEVVSREVIGLQKQEHSTAALIADGIPLPLANGSRQKEAVRRAFRRDPDPSFPVSKLGVFTNLKAQLTDEERQRGVIFVDEESSEVQSLRHSPSLPYFSRRGNARLPFGILTETVPAVSSVVPFWES